MRIFFAYAYKCCIILFARLLIEKKRPFFLAVGFCYKYAFITSQLLLRHSKIPDRSSDSSFFEEFRKPITVHNLKCIFLFSRDFVLAFSGLFFRFIYKATGFFFTTGRERAENDVLERERLIDRVKKGYCFL